MDIGKNINLLAIIDKLDLEILSDKNKTQEIINEIKSNIIEENKDYISNLLYSKLIILIEKVIKHEPIDSIISNMEYIYGAVKSYEKDILSLELKYRIFINRKLYSDSTLIEKNILELLDNISFNLNSTEKIFNLCQEIATYGIKVEMRQVTQKALEKLNKLNEETNL